MRRARTEVEGKLREGVNSSRKGRMEVDAGDYGGVGAASCLLSELAGWLAGCPLSQSYVTYLTLGTRLDCLPANKGPGLWKRGELARDIRIPLFAATVEETSSYHHDQPA